MKLSLPYIYSADVVPPRCRKSRRVRQEATITLTINEISSADAPVAIVEHSRDFVDNKPVQVDTTYRWWRNRLYTLYSFERSCGTPRETQTAADFAGDPYPYALVRAASNWDSDGYMDQPQRRAHFRRWASSIVFIDGERWGPASEPRYVVMTFGLGHNHGLGWGTSLSTDRWYNPNISRNRYFRIDQFDAAVAEATRIATARGDTKALPIVETQEPDRFEILIPEAVRLNPQRQHGRGCDFINQVESIIEASPDSTTAGLLAICALAKEISPRLADSKIRRTTQKKVSS